MNTSYTLKWFVNRILITAYYNPFAAGWYHPYSKNNHISFVAHMLSHIFQALLLYTVSVNVFDVILEPSKFLYINPNIGIFRNFQGEQKTSI